MALESRVPTLLVINKTDLVAPLVGAKVEAMACDAKRMRGERPFVFTNLKAGESLQVVINFLPATGRSHTSTAA